MLHLGRLWMLCRWEGGDSNPHQHHHLKASMDAKWIPAITFFSPGHLHLNTAWWAAMFTKELGVTLPLVMRAWERGWGYFFNYYYYFLGVTQNAIMANHKPVNSIMEANENGAGDTEHLKGRMGFSPNRPFSVTASCIQMKPRQRPSNQQRANKRTGQTQRGQEGGDANEG